MARTLARMPRPVVSERSALRRNSVVGRARRLPTSTIRTAVSVAVPQVLHDFEAATRLLKTQGLPPAMLVAASQQFEARTKEIDMTNETWVLLQLFVAGCTGLVMWGVVRLVADLWNRAAGVRRQGRRA